MILLTRELLEMDYFGWMKFRNERFRRWHCSQCEWLLRVTLPRVLGSEFAQKNRIWL